MRKLNSLIAMVLLFFFCSETDEISGLSEDHNSINMKVGDSWLYRTRILLYTSGSSTPESDEVCSYLYYSAEDDTSIDGRSCLLLDGIYYNLSGDKISTSKSRWAVGLGDTVRLYELAADYDYYFPRMLKRLNGDGKIRLMRENGYTASSAELDSTLLENFLYSIIYPLVKDSVFSYRDSDNINGGPSVVRKYCGIEEVTVPAGRFFVYRFDQYFAGGSDEGHHEWIGAHGLVKREMSGNRTKLDGATVTTIGTFREITELVGHEPIDPDTLVALHSGN